MFKLLISFRTNPINIIRENTKTPVITEVPINVELYLTLAIIEWGIVELGIDALGIMALGILALGIMALGIMTLGFMTCKPNNSHLVFRFFKMVTIHRVQILLISRLQKTIQSVKVDQ